MTVDAGSEKPQADATPSGDPMLMMKALRSVPTLLRSTSDQDDLRNDPEGYAGRLQLPNSAGPLLLHIVNTAERSERPPQGPARRTQGAPVENSSASAQVRSMLMQPFGHITWTFRILTGMSVAMFLVGVAFMGVALLKAVNEQNVSTSTLMIAGVGLADLVVLFYRRPWEDITRGLSNSQQARIIATTYLSGVSMIKKDDPTAQTTLQTLTRDAVELLEQFTEPPGTARD